ncbi:MAG: hypothetical protein WCV62_05205 [Candidatus Peribacteraceae bacterium]
MGFLNFKNTQRHRHLVAAPLVLLAALLTLGVADSSLWKASAVPVTTITIPSGTEVRLGGGLRALGGEEGATMEGGVKEYTLLRGSMLLKSEGVARVQMDRWAITLLDGTVFVERTSSQKLSIAAITAHALVQDGEGRGLVVPVTRQWKSTDPLEAASLQDVPASFLQEQRTRAQGMKEEALPNIVKEPPALMGGPWVFPSAVERAQGRNEDAVFGYIRHLLATRQWSVLQGYLALPEVTAFLGESPLTQSLLPALILQSEDTQRASLLLLPFVAADPDAFVLLSVHPVFRDAAWLLPAPPPEGERMLTLLRSVPAADTLAEAFSEGIHLRWQEAVRHALTRAETPATLAQSFLEDGIATLESLLERGYVHRLVRYAEEYRELAEPYADSAEEVQAALRRIRALEAGAEAAGGSAGAEEERVADVPAPVSPNSPSEDPLYTEEEIRSLTYTALRDAGALFMVTTEIRPLTTGKAAVEGILFGNGSFSFEFDPLTRTVNRITKGETVLPFSLSFEKFVAWARE